MRLFHCHYIWLVINMLIISFFYVQGFVQGGFLTLCF